MKKFALFILLAAFSAGCSSRSAQIEAESVMRTFFHALSRGDYETAVSLYDGGYQALIQMNPSVSPTDYAALWQNGCEFNGFVCMEVMEIAQVDESDSQIRYLVTFKTKDGELFQFTGCCGESLPEPITQYEILIQKDADGKYKVLSLPPYVP